MLRATVLLCLVTSAVLTQSLAITDTTQSNDPIDDGTIVDYLSDSQLRDDGSINDTLSRLSGLPVCSTDYSRMSIANRKMIQQISSKPFSICVRYDGYFVAASDYPNLPYFYMFDPHGWVKRRIKLPFGTPEGAGCAFTPTSLFYSAGNEILQFSNDGKISQGVFVGGFQFFRIATQGYMLYTTVRNSRQILAYNTRARTYVRNFFTTNGDAHDLAFDPDGNLHVTTFTSFVERFTPQGQLILPVRSFPAISKGDGITVDSNFYTIITDPTKKYVMVFDNLQRLVKTISGFDTPAAVAQGFLCSCLIVTDTGPSAIYLL